MLQAWANGLDYDRALPMLDWDGDQVVADGTLHRTRAGARRHVDEIRIVVHPEYNTLLSYYIGNMAITRNGRVMRRLKPVAKKSECGN